jgi:putative tryptophan/tyrosine transport system substrate-binding protein
VGVLFPGLLGPDRERLIAEGLLNELGPEKAVLVVRSAEGNGQLLRNYAAELAASVDLMLAVASDSLAAAREASKAIPIVALDLESDPIAIGAAQSLNRPGGNVTGIFFDAPEIAGKWIQIIRELKPQTATVALLFDAHLDQTQLKSGEETARKIGIQTLRLGIDQPSELRGAFQRAVDAKVDAMLVHSSPIFVDQAAVIAGLGREFRLPTIGLFSDLRQGWRPDFLWPKQFRAVQAGRRRRWKNSPRRKTGRISHPEAGLSFLSDQYEHGQTAAAHGSSGAVRNGRRSHRVMSAWTSRAPSACRLQGCVRG